MTQFFISFCAGCILIGSLHILCPEGSISKPVKYIFSLIFLIIIISAANIPLKKMDFSNPVPEIAQTNLSQMDIAAAEYVYSHTLKSQNINFSKIDIYTDNSENNSIVITKVVIVSDEPHQKIIAALGVLAENRKVEILNE